MRKDSEKVLEILLKMRAERNTDQIKTKASDFKDIPNIDMNQSDILEDLKRNKCVSEKSSLSIHGEMNVYLTLDGIDYFNDKKKEEMDKMKNGMTINVRDNAQFNLAQDNGTINAIQNNGVSGGELDKIVKSIMDNLKDLDKEDADKIVDVVEMAREELVRSEPRPGRLRSCLSLIAPMIAVANGIPVLADNLQKFADYIQMLVH